VIVVEDSRAGFVLDRMFYAARRAAGADPDATDDQGRSPRDFAVRHNDPDVLALLR
jgi:hypothetical protein